MPRTNTLASLTLLAMSLSIVGCTSTCIAQAPDRDALCQKMLELAAEGQPEGENGWPKLVEIGKRVLDLESDFDQHWDRSEFEWGVASYPILFSRPGGNDVNDEMDRDCIEFTRLLLEHYETESVFKRIDTALSHHRLVPTSCEQPYPSDHILFRLLGRVLLAKAAEAAMLANFDIAITRLAQVQRLYSALARVPGLYSSLYSAGMQQLWINAYHFVLAQPQLSADSLHHFERLLSNTPLHDLDLIAEGMKLEFLLMVAKLYSNNGQFLIQDIEFAKAMADLIHSLRPDSEKDNFDLPPTFAELRILVDRNFRADYQNVLTNIDSTSKLLTLDMQGLRLILAVRKFKELHGELPESLDKLAPQYIDAIPTDARFGTPFGYKRLADDPFGREFIVYSWGADGVDNGGHEHPTNPLCALIPLLEDPDDPQSISHYACEGYDYAINYVYMRSESDDDANDSVNNDD